MTAEKQEAKTMKNKTNEILAARAQAGQIEAQVGLEEINIMRKFYNVPPTTWEDLYQEASGELARIKKLCVMMGIDSTG